MTRKEYLEIAKDFTPQEFQVFVTDFLIKILEEVKGIKHKMQKYEIHNSKTRNNIFRRL